MDDGILFIIDDSNKEFFDFNKIIYQISKFPNYNDIYIIRHHNLIKSLRWSSNMKGPQDFIESKLINQKLNKNGDKNIKFIYGDGGGSYRLPRGDCRITDKIVHIINGIGDYNNDLILVVNRRKIYFMDLNLNIN